MKRLAIIDGKSVFYRGYYAMPNLATNEGTPTGGVYGFAALSLELIKKLEPDFVAVAWDKKGTSIRKRIEILPTYKAGRKKPPEDFYAQLPLLYEFIEACGWPLLECDDFEADDIMGTLAKQAGEQGIETCLITSDLDMLQLIDEKTKVFAMKNGLANLEEFSKEYFEKKYQISTAQFLDLKALKGDTSDNIPGVPGIGEKGATTLLQNYASLDGIYDHLDEISGATHKKLVAGKESAYMSKKVAQIWCDAPVKFDSETMNARNLDTHALAQLLKKMQFTSLIRRLPDHMQNDSLDLFGNEILQTKPLEIVQFDESFLPDGAMIIYADAVNLWISCEEKTVMFQPLSAMSASTWEKIQSTQNICYDAKQLYRALAKIGKVSELDVFDVRQASFLLNPLKREHTISAWAEEDIADDDGAKITAVLWKEFRRAKDEFLKIPSLEKIARELDFPLSFALFSIESRGIGVDVDFLKKMSDELTDEFSSLEQKMYTLAGREFNIGSPSQLSKVLFEDLMLPTTGIKKGKTGYSTGQKELDKLRGAHEIIELIERTRELAKLKNTYVDSLPKLVGADGRIHTTFNQDVASTGRLSSINPNLQNIPVRSEVGRRVRRAFIANPGNVFVSADYSQFELRLAAILAHDTELITDFNNEIDVHAKTASRVYDIPPESVTKDQRRDAKVINFGVLYGMSPHGLSAATGMNFFEAKQFIEQYFTLRAPIRDFLDKTLVQAEEEGFVETFYGRRRPTPDVKSSNFMVREGAKRAAMNMPIQGTEADLMKRAMLQVERELQESKLGEQILQIHDSILVECPEGNAERVAALLKKTMESIAPELAISLHVDISIGDNWGDV